MKVGKALALLGLILIIVGLLPIWATFLAGYVDLSAILVYFDQHIYSIALGSYTFTEVMLILTGLGVVLFLIGLVK